MFDRIRRSSFLKRDDNTNKKIDNDLKNVSRRLHELDLSPHSEGSTCSIGNDNFNRVGITVWQLLYHKTLGPKFRTYAETLYADEGIKFLDDIFVNMKEPDYIYSKYISTDLINISHENRISLDKQKASDFSSNYIYRDVINEVINDIKQSDTMRNFVNNDEEAKEYTRNIDAVILNMWICKEKIDELINNSCEFDKLNVLTMDVINMLKFCSIFKKTRPDEDKKQYSMKLNKIYSLFIEKGSLYEVSLNNIYEKYLYADTYECMSDIYEECIRKLSENKNLMELVMNTRKF